MLVTLGVRVTAEVWPFEGFVTKANCSRIAPGMSREEVYRLLGSPGQPPMCGFGIPLGECPEYWEGFTVVVRVDFDMNGRVIRERHSLAQ